LNVKSQTATALGGTDTVVGLSGASSYSVTLRNTSGNSSNWYIPTLVGTQTGSDWSVRVVLNGVDITGAVMGDGGYMFNATSTLASAGIVLDPGVVQTLTVTFEPLIAGGVGEPYSFELEGLAHPGASEEFGSVVFGVVPEPAGLVLGIAILGLRRIRSRI
jgi:hypothetical protein